MSAGRARRLFGTVMVSLIALGAFAVPGSAATTRRDAPSAGPVLVDAAASRFGGAFGGGADPWSYWLYYFGPPGAGLFWTVTVTVPGGMPDHSQIPGLALQRPPRVPSGEGTARSAAYVRGELSSSERARVLAELVLVPRATFVQIAAGIPHVDPRRFVSADGLTRCDAWATGTITGYGGYGTHCNHGITITIFGGYLDGVPLCFNVGPRAADVRVEAPPPARRLNMFVDGHLWAAGSLAIDPLHPEVRIFERRVPRNAHTISVVDDVGRHREFDLHQCVEF